MLLRLFLLFTLVPVIELALLIKLGTVIGALPTVAIVLTTGAVGAWLARREGFAVLMQLRDELQKGLPPATKLTEGALVLAGALLLVTPGVLTDVTGLLLLLPPSRRFLAPRVLAWVMRRMRVEVTRRGNLSPPQPEPEPPVAEVPGGDPHFDHPVPEEP